MAPNPGRLVTLYTGTLDTGGVTWGEHHVKTKAGTTVMRLQAYVPGTASDPAKARREAWNTLPHSPRKETTLPTPDLQSPAPRENTLV